MVAHLRLVLKRQVILALGLVIKAEACILIGANKTSKKVSRGHSDRMDSLVKERHICGGASRLNETS